MQKSKLIQSLKALTTEELKRFHDFMQSPFFKKSANAQVLFEWIYQQGDHPTYASAQLDSEVIAQHLFLDKRSLALKIKSVSVAASEIIVLFRQFLVQLEVEKEENRNNYLLMRSLEERRMERDFWQVYRKFAPKLEESKDAIGKYSEQYLLKELVCNFRPTDKQLKRELKKKNINIHDALHSFEVHVILNKLQYCCYNWNDSNILIVEKNKTLANELISTIQSRNLDQIILVNFYYLNLLMLVNPNIEAYFFKLKNLLEVKGEQVEKAELRIFYLLGTNYCGRKIKQGKLDFRKEVFDLYRLMLRQKMVYSGKFIKKGFIKNIVTTGLEIGQINWVKQFIEDAQVQTIPEYRESVYAFNKGLLHFHQQEYSDAIPLLLVVDNIDVFYNLDCRSLLLKCYYELEETEVFFGLADAFRKFVRQQKIALTQKEAYLNFMSQIVKLYKIKLNPNKSMGAAEVQSILETQPLSNQKWLLEKAKSI